MMKLGWTLINRRDALWVKLLREEYRCGDDIIRVINSKKLGSEV